MNVAIVHDYLHQFGGAEKLIEQWLQIYPNATIYTSFVTPEKFTSSKIITKAYQEGRIRTTWLQWWLPKVINLYKHFFWLYPLVMSSVTVKNFDKVIISSTYCGKNIRLKNNTQTVHYCHSPTRFLHGLTTETDHKNLSRAYQLIIPFFKPWLRFLDLRAAKYLTEHNVQWIANSKHIQTMIRDVYGVNSEVIYPAVEIDNFLENPRAPKYGDDKFYLCHGRISFHKRIDLAIIACITSGRNLQISGTGAFPQELDKLKILVKKTTKHHIKNNPTIRAGKVKFLGRTTMPQLLELMKQCSAFIFPGIEDFGIAPIEMLAGGIPLIAYGEGGALEYVTTGKNGVLFPRQNVDSLIDALNTFDTLKLNVPTIRNTAKPFSEEVFIAKFQKLLT